MSSSTGRDPAQVRLLLLTAVLFVSYLCVAIPLPVLPLQVTGQLGLNNVWAGLSIGIAFLATILTRGHAGSLSDRRGTKIAVRRGLALYAAGGALALAAGLPQLSPGTAIGVLIAGRLILGLGESLVGVGVVAWGIGMVGPARTGRVLALIGAAIYGAYALGGPVGLFLFEKFGYVGAMGACILLPCFGLIAIQPIAGVAPHPEAERPSFTRVMGRIWRHGAIVCLQGIGFAAIGAFFVLYCLDKNWAHAGLGFTAFGVGFVLMRVLFGHLPDRFGGLSVAIASLAIETVGQFLIWGAHAPALAFLGAFVTGLGCSMIFPSMGREVVHLVEPHLRGTALGGFTAFQDLAYGLTGPIAGFLADRSGYGSVFLIGSLAAATGFLIALRLRSAHVRRTA